MYFDCKRDRLLTPVLINVACAKDSFITTWTDMSFRWADHRRPTFSEPFVTKPVVTQGTNRCQMKDMFMVFQTPLSLL